MPGLFRWWTSTWAHYLYANVACYGFEETFLTCDDITLPQIKCCSEDLKLDFYHSETKKRKSCTNGLCFYVFLETVRCFCYPSIHRPLTLMQNSFICDIFEEFLASFHLNQVNSYTLHFCHVPGLDSAFNYLFGLMCPVHNRMLSEQVLQQSIPQPWHPHLHSSSAISFISTVRKASFQKAWSVRPSCFCFPHFTPPMKALQFLSDCGGMRFHIHGGRSLLSVWWWHLGDFSWHGAVCFEDGLAQMWAWRQLLLKPTIYCPLLLSIMWLNSRLF